MNLVVGFQSRYSELFDVTRIHHDHDNLAPQRLGYFVECIVPWFERLTTDPLGDRLIVDIRLLSYSFDSPALPLGFLNDTNYRVHGVIFIHEQIASVNYRVNSVQVYWRLVN